MDLMSAAQLLGNFGELLGSVGVLATLIYLSVQVRQNTKMMKATIRQELSKASTDATIQYSKQAEAWVKIQDPRGRPEWDSPAQELEAEWLTTSGFRSWENYAWQHGEGLVGTDDWEGIVEDMRHRGTFPYIVDQWRQTRRRYSARLREVVDPIFGVTDNER